MVGSSGGGGGDFSRGFVVYRVAFEVKSFRRALSMLDSSRCSLPSALPPCVQVSKW